MAKGKKSVKAKMPPMKAQLDNDDGPMPGYKKGGVVVGALKIKRK